MATQKSGKERQSSSSSSSSLLNISPNSMTKSINGPMQYHNSNQQPNRAKPVPSKRSVNPNSRAHSSTSTIDADLPRRSLTPTSKAHGDGDHESLKDPNNKRTVTPLSRIPSIVARDSVYTIKKLTMPKNAEDLASDADFADCVEILPEGQEKSQVKNKLEENYQSYLAAVEEARKLKKENSNLLSEQEKLSSEVAALREKLLAEEKQRITFQNEVLKLKRLVPDISENIEDKKLPVKPHMNRELSSLRHAMGLTRSISGQKATIAKICEEVGLEKIIKLLSSEDIEVQMHALKVVANLAAEDISQEKIVKEGGLDALLMLLQTSQNSTILRVASGAIANLAMIESNQDLIMSKGGAQLLGDTASKTDDPPTLRMVAGAIANLCGYVTSHMALKQDGCIRALLHMATSTNADVIAQVARGLANFAKCEAREVIQGHKMERSLLMEDGALEWLIVNSQTTSDSTKRHIELALCHLAQNEENAQDFVSSGGLKEVLRISSESSREDIRNLARKTARSNPTFLAEIGADR